MIALNEARIVQKNKSKSSIFKFSIGILILTFFFTVVFIYTELLTISSAFILIPILFVFIIAKYSDVLQFFLPKEFVGMVIDIHIYRITERVSKGVGGGHGASGGTHFEAEVMLQNEKERIMIKTFWIGDVTSHLEEGDTIAVLRFIDEPILIKGKYWTDKEI